MTILTRARTTRIRASTGLKRRTIDGNPIVAATNRARMIRSEPTNRTIGRLIRDGNAPLKVRRGIAPGYCPMSGPTISMPAPLNLGANSPRLSKVHTTT